MCGVVGVLGGFLVVLLIARELDCVCERGQSRHTRERGLC
jgi:hypothetical protein